MSLRGQEVCLCLLVCQPLGIAARGGDEVGLDPWDLS